MISFTNKNMKNTSPKKENIKKFDEEYEQFLIGKDPILHRQAIKTFLSEAELDEWFQEFIDEKDGTQNFFLMWEQAGVEEKDPKEKKGLERLGEQSKKLYNKKDYKKLAELFFNITLRHLADFIHLEDRENFKEITDHDLYTKELIPPAIYLQFFLIETLIKRDDFDWNRSEEITYQNLACLAICFMDINSFFNELE